MVADMVVLDKVYKELRENKMLLRAWVPAEHVGLVVGKGENG
jgi:hypothetical protein